MERTDIEIDGDAELKVGQAFRVNKINGTIDGSALFPGVWQVVRVLEPRGGKRRYEVEKIDGNRHEVRAKLAKESR